MKTATTTKYITEDGSVFLSIEKAKAHELRSKLHTIACAEADDKLTVAGLIAAMVHQPEAVQEAMEGLTLK